MVLLAAVTRSVLGPGLLSIKAIALLFSTGTFVVWILVLHRLFGARTAGIFALLAVLAPPEAAKLELMAWGIHQESALPAALALLLAVALWGGEGALLAHPAQGARPLRERALAAGTGFFLALAVCFSWLALVNAAALLLVVALLGRGGWSGGRSAALLFGAALGAVPLVAYNAAWGFAGLFTLAPGLGPPPGGALARLLELARHLGRYLSPHLGLPRAVEGLYALGVAAALAGLGARALRGVSPGRRVPGELLLLGAPLLFASAYALSGYAIAPEWTGVIAYRYLGPLTPFLLATLATALARLPRTTGAILALAAAAGPAAHLARDLPSASMAVLARPGQSDFMWGFRVYEVEDRLLGRALAKVERIPDPDRQQAAVEGVACAHASWVWLQSAGPPAARLQRFARSLGEAGQADRAVVLRLARILEVPGRLELDEAGVAALLPPIAGDASLAPLLGAAVAALGRGPGGRTASLAALARLPPELRPAGSDGLGVLDGSRSAAFDPPPVPELARTYARGYGRGLALAALQGDGTARAEADATHPPRPAPVVPASLPGELAKELAIGIREWLRIAEPEDLALRRERAERAGLRPFEG